MILNIFYKKKIYSFHVDKYSSIGHLKALFMDKVFSDYNSELLKNIQFFHQSKLITNEDHVSKYTNANIEVKIAANGGSAYLIPGNQLSLTIFLSILYVFFANMYFSKFIEQLVFPYIETPNTYIVNQSSQNFINKIKKGKFKWWQNQNIIQNSNICGQIKTQTYSVSRTQTSPLYILAYIMYMITFFIILFGLVLGGFTKTSCGKPKGAFIGISLLFLVIITIVIPFFVPYLPKIMRFIYEKWQIIKNLAIWGKIRKLFRKKSAKNS